MKRALLTLLLAFMVFYGQAQDCNQYHRKACKNDSEYSMSYDSQSRSATLGKGQISEFHMVAYDGLDYRITVCAEESLGEEIYFKIYEKRRILMKPEEVEQLQVYEEDKIKINSQAAAEELSDPAYSDDYDQGYADPYADQFVEDNASTASKGSKFKLVKELLYNNQEDSLSNSIEFSAESSMSLIVEVAIPGQAGKSKLNLRNMGCVGVLIEHTKSRKAGF